MKDEMADNNKFIKANFCGFINGDVEVTTERHNVNKAEYAMCLLALIERFVESEKDLALLFAQATECYKKKKE